MGSNDEGGLDEKRARELVAAAAHELKTPLVLIRGLIEALEDNAYDSEEKKQEYLYRINYSAQNALALVDDILTVAKLESHQLNLELEPVSPQSLIYDVAHELDPIAKRFDQQLRVKRSRGPTIYVNKLSAQRILHNLLSNAIKYSAPGAITTLSTKNLGDRIRINVVDQGVGISEDELKKIFAKFGTAKQPESKMSGSTGLGLHIVKSLTEAMDGDFGVQARRKGSEFYVSFPVTQQLSLLSS